MSTASPDDARQILDQLQQATAALHEARASIQHAREEAIDAIRAAVHGEREALDQAAAQPHDAGERIAILAEELGVQQRVVHGAAVHR